MIGEGARIHQCLRNHREVGINCRCFVDVHNEIGILDKVHPEAQGQAIRFPSMHHFGISQIISLRSLVEQIEYPFDGNYEERENVKRCKNFSVTYLEVHRSHSKWYGRNRRQTFVSFPWSIGDESRIFPEWPCESTWRWKSCNWIPST